MNYELALKLKNAGFPQKPKISTGGVDGEIFGGFYHVGMVDGDGAFGFFTDTQYAEYLKRDSSKHVIAKEPTLSELIEACGEFSSLTKSPRGTWYCAKSVNGSVELVVGDEYSTPEEAVARFWLALIKTGV